MAKTSREGAGGVPIHLGLVASLAMKRMERMGWSQGAAGHPWLGTGAAGTRLSA